MLRLRINLLTLASGVLGLLGLVCSEAGAAATTGIVAVNSGQCLNVGGGSTQSGAGIIQWPCSAGSNEQWTFVPLANGFYHIVSQKSQMCLNVPASSRNQGVQLIQWPCQGAAATNDQWKIQPVDVGAYHIVSASSGQCVNIFSGVATQGTKVVQWPCQGKAQVNDQFMFDYPGSKSTALPSAWSGVIPLPVTPVGVANLPDNKLMMWSADFPDAFSGDSGNGNSKTYTALFDAAKNAPLPLTVVTTGSNLFCPGTSMLSNGNLLINGGSSSPKTQIYDWAAKRWSASGNMNIPRGYEANTVLSDGRVLTLGGSWSGGYNSKSRPNRTGEVWEGGHWKVLAGVPENNVIGPDPQDTNGSVYRGDNHLWLFASSGGMVFHAGPSAQMNWIGTSGSGSIVSAGTRGNDPYSINGNAVMVDAGQILKLGGAPAYQQNTGTTYASNSAYLIDIRGGPKAPVKVKPLPGMSYRRAFANSVVLPDGDVVVVGGQTIPQPFTDSYAVLTPELWSAAKQTFSPLKPMQVPRTYHSTAILLQDGRVFVGGGGLCGANCPQNHLNAEILTPPYLLNADGSLAARPVISAAPAQARPGSVIEVKTQQAASHFSLVRLSAVTHSVNNDQRRIALSVSKLAPTGGETSYSLQIPADSGVVLPGNYMLFAMSPQGVPSVARIITIN
ncbi:MULTISPECIES: RICIN domain-containing protein [Chromobacterium]|uniref:RICIN domain-containing protein n=1 Tax=Chromobacterium TaxID=535 RepID=UPI001888A84E|nr:MULTISPECIES: RICIN domain-containing protein [Chromobacterium]QOZ83629.1 DUF1929 domain-containing protein [Chromobacterium sp. Rain0013]WON83747.1 RICIN domain-containing protein [Chromobacterium haemolyticum]